MGVLPPSTRLSPERIPEEHRAWTETSILSPLNRFIEPLMALLSRGFSLTGNANAQTIQLSFTCPASWSAAGSALQVLSTLAGSCVHLFPTHCEQIDGSGTVTGAVSGLTLPAWSEVLSTDRASRAIRITNQPGLTAGTRYRVTWLAVGA
jgi:hypothetical protein